MGNHDKAVEDFSRAIAIEETHALAWYYRGKSKLAQARLLPASCKLTGAALEGSKKHEKLG